jgi:hypothetical protein
METAPAIRRMGAWFALAVFAWMVLTSPVFSQQTPATRTFESGPLTANDFAGKSDPEKVRMGTSAFTVCELRWTYDSRWQDDGEGKVVMKVGKLGLECLVIPDQSWNLIPDDETLLVHEQGHFELWYINTLRARIAWLKKKSEGGIEVVAPTRKECEQLLDKKVIAFCKEFVDAARNENQEYDRATSKGTNLPNQSEARRVQQATIKQLESRLRPEPGKSK